MKSERTVKKSLRLTEKEADYLRELKHRYEMSEAEVVGYCLKQQGEQINAKMSEGSIEKRLNRIEESEFHLMNMLNSLLHSLKVESSEYASAKEQPESILSQSEDELHTYMMRMKSKI